MPDHRANREIAVVYEIGKVLALSTDINRALTSALTLLRVFLDMRNGTVALFDPVTAEIFIEAAPEMTDAERIRGRYRPREGITGRIFDSGVPMVIPDAGAEALFLNRTGARPDFRERRTAFLGVPIRDGRLTLGVLTVDRPAEDASVAFDRDIRVMTAVAHLIAARVRLHQLENPWQRAKVEEGVPFCDGALRFAGVIGRSSAMREVLDMVARVAPSRATVLLRGESGTGKELIARAIHDNSPRANRPFVVLNCAAIPDTLLESELFGHEKGAFTGATHGKPGHFEVADGGTLFLDEIGETPLAAQVKLLRVLQERQVERVGGREPISLDVRIVAATNRDLEGAVREGGFRFDLYHRLSVVTLLLPPLRDRQDDIPALADDFLRALGTENGKQQRFSAEAIETLLACRWAGNVRQLRNCIERLVVTTDDSLILARHFACRAASARVSCLLESFATIPGDGGESIPPPAREFPRLTEDATDEERGRILNALKRSGWVKAKAARLLGMTVRQLSYRVTKYGIELERL